MKRNIEKILVEWKNRLDRKPLLIRGARQVGKSYIVELFGKTYFESIVKINFEEMKNLKKSFEGDLTPSLLLRDLSTRLNTPIVPGKTLLFFDEIQACPQALLSLRFFKEQMPDLHVIGAGSLLEFILGDDQFSFPVGRIEYLYMKPFSFMEFLEARGEHRALEWIQEATPAHPIGEASHQKLLSHVKEYFITGGMPEAIHLFLQHNSFIPLSALQNELLSTYESDFSKYPKNSQQKFMKLLFEATPRLVGEHFKFAKIKPHAQSRDYIESLDVLSRSGILHQVFWTAASGLPLSVQIKENKFKLLFLDIGILPKGNIISVLDAPDLVLVNKGVLAEQFVGQELIAYTHPSFRPEIYFWEREKQGSQAEVDYVVEIGSHIIPLEVKAGARGRLRSLKQFMLEKQSILGIRVSEATLSIENHILSVPFYMIREIPRLVLQVLR